MLLLSARQDEIREEAEQETRYHKLVDESAQIETWLENQFDVLIAKFKPAMGLD